MIDVKALREDPDRFKRGAREKRIDVDVERLLRVDEERRQLMQDQEAARAEQKRAEQGLE